MAIHLVTNMHVITRREERRHVTRSPNVQEAHPIGVCMSKSTPNDHVSWGVVVVVVVLT
jgi:hypothetical protein